MICSKFQDVSKKYRKLLIQMQILCVKLAIASGRGPEPGGSMHQCGLRQSGLYVENDPRGGN